MSSPSESDDITPEEIEAALFAGGFRPEKPLPHHVRVIRLMENNGDADQ